MNLPRETDVLLVGLGPVGAALANLLGQYGVRLLAIDKATEIFRAPRAIALDNEALRVLQMCGIQDGDIDTVAIPEVRMHSPHFGFYSRADTAGAIDGHPKLVTFYQPQLEEVLRARLAAHSTVQVALGASLLGFEQDAAGVHAQIRDRNGAQHEVHCRYIVGTDGANSMVRSLLGLDFKGKTYAEDWLVVDARRLPQPIDHVEFLCDPQRPTPHMVAPGDRQRWEFKLRPGETREQMEHPDTVRHLLAPWAQGQEIDIERVAVYRFHARVAHTFQVKRAFLAGDAAHITPPFVGQGLVAGLRDAANLAWKLAWVVQGRAQEALLQTYSRERQPHAREMIRLAQWMGRLVMPVNSVQAWFTHGLMKTLSSIPRFKNLFENLEIKPANRFKAGCFASGKTRAGLVRGGQLPQGWVRSLADREHRLSDDALGQGLVLVGFGVDPAASLPQDIRSQWRRAGGQFLRIAPRGQPANQASVPTWEDLDNSFGTHKVPAGWVATVRPDRVVMADGPLACAAQLAQQSLALLSAT